MKSSPTPRRRLHLSVIALSGVAMGSGLHASSDSESGALSPVATPLAIDPAAAAIPIDALMPKTDIQADVFLDEYPEYDGRGVTVAIFDTGVDPGAPGMQTTPDGRPKIVDIVDGTGSGDVDTTTVVELEGGRTVEGLSGRELTLPTSWSIPDGTVRLGLKPAHELYPGGLSRRTQNERREDLEKAHRPLIERARTDLGDWDADHLNPTKDEFVQREELAARVSLLESMMEDYGDPGPIHDCVVWHDGDTWRAAVDTDEDGDFADEVALTNFRDERGYATFDDENLLNFVINIYNDGDVLSIVTDVGAHGTHVAGIVAAFFPDQPELSGIAPGAQIVSVKIGDHRLGASSVNTGSVRGMIACLQNDVDVINMSYGGFSPFPNRGRIADLYNEIVNEHGVVFVSSAGNSGPALSTTGSPGGTTESIIGVGAALSPDMMEAQYQFRDPYGELQFPWSSRGPTLDGSMGVDITAPGGAISPVPNWLLQRSTQMNGTSMSSPNAAGGVALLISALKAEQIEYSPHSIKRALIATARPMDGMSPADAGAGMMQVRDAWTILDEFGDPRDDHARYELSVGGDRGVYLREPHEIDRPLETTVSVNPRFPDDYDTQDLVDFEVSIGLESTERWIESSSGMHLVNNGGSFRVRVDPTGLPPGAHFGSVIAYDTANPDRGPLFSLPVTVIRPTEFEGTSYEETVAHAQGEVGRRFLRIPDGATWADISLRRLDEDTPRTVLLHAVQLLEQHSASTINFRQWITLDSDEEQRRSMAVVGGGTLEIATCNWWSNVGDTEFELRVDFRGVTPDQGTIAAGPYDEVVTVMVSAMPDAPTAIRPSAAFDTLRRVIAPDDWSIRALPDERDVLPDGERIHEAVIDYSIDIPADGSYSIEVAMGNLPGLYPMVESGIWYLKDESGRLVRTDGWSDSLGTLHEGTYTLEVHVRSDDVDRLERVAEMGVYLDREVSRINLRASRDRMIAADESTRHGTRTLRAGETVPVYFRMPQHDSMPEHAEPGDILLGSATFGSDAGRLEGTPTRPGGYPIMLVIGPEPEARQHPTPEEAEPADNRTPEQVLADAILETKVGHLSTFRDDEDGQAAFDELLDEILEDRADHLPALLAALERVDTNEGKTEHSADTKAIVDAAYAVVAAIDQTALAVYYGRNHHGDDAEAMRIKQEMTEQKATLIDALHRSARALGHAALRELDAKSIAAFEVAIDNLESWADIENADYAELRIIRHRVHDRPASALLILSTLVDDDPHDRDLFDRKRESVSDLGWHVWRAQMDRERLLKFPPVDRPF